MGLFVMFRSTKKINGYIGYYHLVDWWLSSFSEDERAFMETHFAPPLGGNDVTLTTGTMYGTTRSAPGFLSDLSGWFNNLEDRSIAIRVIGKALELPADTLDRHFVLGSAVKIYYAESHSSLAARDWAIWACEEQIAMAEAAAVAWKTTLASPTDKTPLPAHRGYEQLAIIREKEKRFDAATEVCNQAREQGWNGEWVARVDRLIQKQATHQGQLPTNESA